MTTEQRRKIAERYVGKDCTLDGKPAFILGRLLPCGFVCPVTDPSHPGIEFSWSAIAHVMSERSGQFKSD